MTFNLKNTVLLFVFIFSFSSGSLSTSLSTDQSTLTTIPFLKNNEFDYQKLADVIITREAPNYSRK